MELQTHQQYRRDTQKKQSESGVRAKLVPTVASFGQGWRAEGEELLAKLWVALAHARVEGTGGEEGALPLPTVEQAWEWVWIETWFRVL